VLNQTSDFVETAAQDKYLKIRKLKMMSPMSAEATVVRTYVDWMLSLPWNTYTKDNEDLINARKRYRWSSKKTIR